ncbi:hypothetical protein EMCRGX_G011660 [Ephydatia muelleri]
MVIRIAAKAVEGGSSLPRMVLALSASEPYGTNLPYISATTTTLEEGWTSPTPGIGSIGVEFASLSCKGCCTSLVTQLTQDGRTECSVACCSVSDPHAVSWLSVVPSIGLGLHLEPNEYQMAIR